MYAGETDKPALVTLVVVVFELEEQPAKSEAIIIITEITNINLFILFLLFSLLLSI